MPNPIEELVCAQLHYQVNFPNRASTSLRLSNRSRGELLINRIPLRPQPSVRNCNRTLLGRLFCNLRQCDSGNRLSLCNKYWFLKLILHKQLPCPGCSRCCSRERRADKLYDQRSSDRAVLWLHLVRRHLISQASIRLSEWSTVDDSQQYI